MPEHAQDLGKVIADVRTRVGGPVWLVGTSRGTISAANAASRLTGPAAPDGIVLTSALMVGNRGQKAFVTRGAREQVVTVTGGPGTSRGAAGTIAVCEGRSPHGFVDQEEAVTADIARFIRGERY
jgi:hypothetical protein